MKHADVTLVGSALVVRLDETVPTPQLRSLAPEDQFDPNMPWAALEGTNHNFQYGWNPSGFWAPPSGAGVWVELLEATPGLLTYEAIFPVSGTYDPLFGNSGSSLRWQWSGAMTHNAYAVVNPTRSRYEASYRVYIGDATTGEPTPGYEPAEVTFQWVADVPLADFDDDGDIDGGDFLAWQRACGAGTLTADDLQLWQQQWGAAASAVAAASVPEPAAGGLIALAAAALLVARSRRRLRMR